MQAAECSSAQCSVTIAASAWSNCPLSATGNTTCGGEGELKVENGTAILRWEPGPLGTITLMPAYADFFGGVSPLMSTALRLGLVMR